MGFLDNVKNFSAKAAQTTSNAYYHAKDIVTTSVQAGAQKSAEKKCNKYLDKNTCSSEKTNNCFWENNTCHTCSYLPKDKCIGSCTYNDKNTCVLKKN